MVQQRRIAICFALFLVLFTNIPSAFTQNIDGRRVGYLRWSDNGNYIAGYYRRNVILWNGSTGQHIKTIPLTLSEPPFTNYGVIVIDMDWHPNNKYLAITGTPEGSLIGFILILDVETETILDTFTYSDGSNTKGIPDLSWNHNGSKLAFALNNGNILDGDDSLIILNSDGSLHLEVKNPQMEGISTVSFSPDSNAIVTGGHVDNIARVWNSNTGDLLFSLPGTVEGQPEAQWSPRGDYIATTDLIEVDIWNAVTGNLLYTIPSEIGTDGVIGLLDIEWNYNGNYLAILQDDYFISIRDGSWQEISEIDSLGTYYWSPLDNRIVTTNASSSIITIQTAAASPTTSVTSLALINADTDVSIQTLTSGSTLNLGTLPTRNLNIRADASGSPAKVVFMLNDKIYREDTTAPFTLAEEFIHFAAGNYTLTAIPYDANNVSGVPLTIMVAVF